MTGFDDNIYARLSRPILTTVRQHPSEKGKAAVRMLMRRIYGEETLVSGITDSPTELVVRESRGQPDGNMKETVKTFSVQLS
ncbi:MAG: substrate-binding domain-containing protein [Lachnospiraceae bacterium]